MTRSIELALLGNGFVHPNPLVGCVIVNDGVIISEGFHHKFGAAHAEIDALRKCESTDLSKATVYVTLEPCSHFGKTPPCANALIERQVRRVVIGTKDPNPEVAGEGIQKLLDAGIEVECGVLEKESQHLNRRFFNLQTKGLPWVILKWAQTSDGFIDYERNSATKSRLLVSGKKAALWSQMLRSKEHAILVGPKTYELDAPKLTLRDIGGQTPKRFIINPLGNISTEDFQSISNTHLGCNAYSKNNWEFALLSYLKTQQISSIIIEGGAKTLQSFIDKKLWDECFVVKSKKKILTGIQAPKLNLAPLAETKLGQDTNCHFLNIHDS